MPPVEKQIGIALSGDIVQKEKNGFNSDLLPNHIEKLLILMRILAKLIFPFAENCETPRNLLAYTQRIDKTVMVRP